MPVFMHFKGPAHQIACKTPSSALQTSSDDEQSTPIYENIDGMKRTIPCYENIDIMNRTSNEPANIVQHLTVQTSCSTPGKVYFIITKHL